MIIIRPVKQQDLGVFAEFSFESLLGITNLPRNREKLEEKILHSEASFSEKSLHPGKEEYYFVLEDLTTKRIGGVCGIIAHVDHKNAWFYKIEEMDTHASHLSAPKKMKILKVVNSPIHSSEVCSLYLQSSFRHSGLGRLLSLSRFLFIAAFRNRFEKQIIAEMRGFIDHRQISPFWESIGRHFCNLSFVELMTQLDQDRTFVAEILPKFPIYIDLLPKDARDLIGKTHDHTKPALNMLLQENFIPDQLIDIFDGGPLLSANTSSIRAVKNSSVIKIAVTEESLCDEKEYILSNDQLNFRACFGNMRIIDKHEALINQETADALCIQDGNKIRYITARA